MPLNRPEAQSMVMEIVDQMALQDGFTREEIIRVLWRETVQTAIRDAITTDRVLEARR
jgi:hypothetical protein